MVFVSLFLSFQFQTTNMGIFHSKISPMNKQSEQLNNFVDPRSPTFNINRSPIGIETVLDKPSITKVRDLTADLTEILDHAQTPDRFATSDKLQSALDPRSQACSCAPAGAERLDASNRSLRGSSVEYEEIDCDGELSFKDCTATDISEVLSVGPTDGTSGSIFSNDTSLNTELKADIDNIIQKLYDAGSLKDPRSPSVDIQRTPIVFQEKQEPINDDEDQTEIQTKEEKGVEQPSAQVPQQDIIKEDETKTTTTKLTIVHQDENTTTPLMSITPKRNKSDLSARKTAQWPSYPLGCVTNVQPLSNSTGGNNVLRKTALIGSMKQSGASTGLGSGTEMIPAGKKLQTRSKIPTFRMK
ncbi:uncharacterized protein LOC134215686 isoform X2 [Armigeres subalbatus]|uniref:uncharacterized protein LOC134215686 isoform X2 n=1 Tax=Armigeres subalbatus TaxID=124917 RepID=UPI002ED17058